MSKDNVEELILVELKKLNEPITVRQLAKNIDQLNNYSWVLKKVKSLEKRKTIKASHRLVEINGKRMSARMVELNE